MDIIDYFRKHPFFQDIPISEIEILARISSLITIEKDINLITINEGISHLYFLIEGSLDIFVRSSEKIGEFARVLNPDSIIGEMELLERRPTIATAKAREKCILYRIKYEDYHKNIQKLPKTNIELFKHALSKWQNIEIEYHKLIDKLEDVSKILLQQQKKIEEESKLKEIFIENVSHDLRTPLTIIQGVIESLEYNNESHDYFLDQKLYNIMKNSSSYLLDLIGDLLDISNITQGLFRLSNYYCNIDSVFKDILDNLSSLALNKGLSYNYKIVNLDSVELLIDLNRVRQIIYNLLSNAVKYTLDGQVNIFMDVKFLEDNECILIIKIQDSGIGMTQEEQKIIFNKFVRVKNKKYDFKGTGLGLSIVDNIVKLMNGKITVSSEINKGSEFLIEIPSKFKHISIIKSKVLKKIDYNQYQKRKILLIDDFKDTHEIIKALLKKYPVTIDSLYSGGNLSNFIEFKEYDLIFIDIMMPDIDGYQVLTELIKTYNTVLNKKRPKMIAFTALSSEDELKKLSESGFNGQLLKPFTKNDLLNVIYKDTPLNVLQN